MKAKIIIEVEKGMVTRFITNTDDIEIGLLDLDVSEEVYIYEPDVIVDNPKEYIEEDLS